MNILKNVLKIVIIYKITKKMEKTININHINTVMPLFLNQELKMN